MQICTAHGVLQAAHAKRRGTGQSCKWYCILQIRTEYGVLPLDHAKRTDAVLDSAVAMLESGNSNAMSLLEPMMEQNEQASAVWSSCCQIASKHIERLRHDVQHDQPMLRCFLGFPFGCCLLMCCCTVLRLCVTAQKHLSMTLFARRQHHCSIAGT